MDDSAPASELGRAGQIVSGKYRLDGVIGRGGMGSVWSATHVGLGRRVAVKLIARQYVRSSEALRRFEAEARAAARLQSRHVVQVFDNGTLDDGTPYIAMELLTGENLSERIERAGPMGLTQAVAVIAQCCKALAHAHAAGIVHRDIKPDNIFLAREADEEGDVVKVLDFGVAKIALEVEGDSQQVTGTGAMLGTPLYMSPEQVRGARDVDLRADLYSLGLVAYTMLTAKSAIDGATFGDILLKICTEPLPSLAAAVPGVPPAVEAWFQRACAREASARFGSAQELIEALRAATGAPVVVGSSAPGLPVTPSMFGDTAAVASTLAAQARVSLPTSPSGASVPVAPSGLHAPAASAAAVAPAASNTFSQSAAAVSLTAAGIPGRRSAVAIGGWIVAGVLAVGAVVVAVVVVTQRGARPASTSPAVAPSPSSLESSPAAPPASAEVLAPLAAPQPTVDAGAAHLAPPGGRATATPPATTVVPTTPSLAQHAPGAPSAGHPAVPTSGPVPPRPAHTIDLGY